MNTRILNWEGCSNVRDLGGLMTRDGRMTCRGAFVRSDHPAKLSAAGWSALYDYGIRTILSLRTAGMAEDLPDSAPRPSDLVTLEVAIEDIGDAEFVHRWASSDLWCTPLYYHDALRRWPERHAAAISAIARARPGGVLIHCKRGNDRTGIVSLLLLALVGVSADEILADYELSPDAERDGLLAREHTTVREALLGALDGLDVGEYLQSGGVTVQDLAAIRQRLLQCAGRS